MAVPRLLAATAMPAPTMARINAYSAAAAPDSSRMKDLRKLVITEPLLVAEIGFMPLPAPSKRPAAGNWTGLNLALGGIDRRGDGAAQVAGGYGHAGPPD